MQLLREYKIGEFKVHEFLELDSTNNYLKKAAAEGGPDGLVAIALSQTGGKGRLGRSFFSPESGLYMSMLLRRELPVSLAHLLTPMTAVAVAEALEETGSARAGIKWVNDIYIGGRKVCGILTETQISKSGQTLDYAVIGIGVNIKAPDDGFPEDIKNRAGAAFVNPTPDTRDRLAANILKCISEHLAGLEARTFIPAYRERSILIGHEIVIVESQSVTPARVLGIDDDCRLIVETSEGIREIFTGEVSIKI